jgi:diaminopimelate epimerase
MRFEKWQALGNDYIVIERDQLDFELAPKRIRALCASHFGCQADGILLLGRSDDAAQVADLRIFNPDGSEAELSGNGVREAALYLRRAGWTDEDTFTLQTVAGEITPTLTGPASASIAMGRAATASPDFPSGPPDGRGTVAVGDVECGFQHVSIGNPQCAIEVVNGLEELDLPGVGPAIESSELFPNRTNASFWRREAAGERLIRARIFERGVGETLSSGTGASGAAVAAFLSGVSSPITVRLDGGELEVEISEALDVRLIGTASPVFSGEFSPEFVAEVEAL